MHKSVSGRSDSRLTSATDKGNNLQGTGGADGQVNASRRPCGLHTPCGTCTDIPVHHLELIALPGRARRCADTAGRGHREETTTRGGYRWPKQSPAVGGRGLPSMWSKPPVWEGWTGSELLLNNTTARTFHSGQVVAVFLFSFFSRLLSLFIYLPIYQTKVKLALPVLLSGPSLSFVLND